MTADAGECNGGPKAEFEGGKGLLGSEVERKESAAVAATGCNGIAFREGEAGENDGEGIGGSFVIVNKDSDEPGERGLDLYRKVDPAGDELANSIVEENGVPPEIAGSVTGEEVVGDQGVREERGENNGELHTETGIKGCDNTVTVSNAEEQNPGPATETGEKASPESGAETGGNGKLGKEGAEEKREISEKKDDLSEETVNGEEGLENGEDDIKEATTADGSRADDGIELESVVEVEEKPEAAATETAHQKEVELAVEGESKSEGGEKVIKYSDGADAEAAVEVEENPEAAAIVTGDLIEPKSTIELEDKIEAETGVTDSNVGAKSELAVEAEENLETAVIENGDQSEAESPLEVKEMKEPDIAVRNTDHSPELKSAAEVEDEQEPETVITEADHQMESESSVKTEMQDLVPAIAGIDDQVQTESAVMAEGELETQRAPTMSISSRSQENSESFVHEEGKQKAETSVAEYKEQAEPESDAERELKQTVAETDAQATCESTEVEEQEPASLNAEVMPSEEARLRVVAGGVPRDICSDTNRMTSEAISKTISKTQDSCGSSESRQVSSVENGASPEVESFSENETAPGVVSEARLQTGDSSESSESHEAVSVCSTDCMVMKAEARSDPLQAGETMPASDGGGLHLVSVVSDSPSESSISPSVHQVVDKEMVKGVLTSVANQQVLQASDRSIECDEAGAPGTEADINTAVGGPSPPGDVSGVDQESEQVHASVKSGIEVEKGFVGSEETMVVSSNNGTVLETRVCRDDVETEKDVSVDHVAAMKSGPGFGDGSLESEEGVPIFVKGKESADKDDVKEPVCEEDEVVKDIQAPQVEPEATEPIRDKEPNVLALDGERADAPVLKRQPCYIIRVPRFTEEGLWTQIEHAKSQVQEKTQSRDSIRTAIQSQRETCAECRRKIETENKQVKDVKEAISKKRQEMETIQLKISRLKDATAVEELNDQIEERERMFQHVTMPLKEEKQFINETKQLRHRRDHISSTLGPRAEIDEAFEQRDEIEEQLKTLKKEFESLKIDLSRAEGNAKSAWKKYEDEQKLLNDLQKQFDTADDIRQKAYGILRDLKKELFEKSKYFKMYKEDQKTAADYAALRDREGLQLHCSKQVERVMELWNNNEEFRKQYVKFNKNSTLRRLKTLDGRSLGPDEEPPVIHSNAERRTIPPLPSSDIFPPAPTSELKSERQDVLAAPKQKDLFPAVPVARPNQPDKSKKSTKSALKETAVATTSDREEIEDAITKNARTKEEEDLARKVEELARKEEELRKEKEAIELKEQLRIEQKAKAKEAEERKRRKAEKAQAKAEYRAQREAETREKKKAKKEKKKATTVDTTNNVAEGECTPVVDSSPPEELQEPGASAATVSKRSSRPPVIAKQYSKIQPLPLPLRNRGKKRMRTWMWVLLTALLIFALFLAGNYISFPGLSLPQFDH